MQFEFDFEKTGEVVAFPAERLRRRLRETAAYIRAKPRAKWDWNFKHECNRIFDEVKMAGFSWEEAARQRRAFAVALECEIRRQIVLEALHEEQLG
jgi:hypothetical protein